MQPFGKRLIALLLMLALLLSLTAGCAKLSELGRQAYSEETSYTLDFDPASESEPASAPEAMEPIDSEPALEPVTPFVPLSDGTLSEITFDGVSAERTDDGETYREPCGDESFSIPAESSSDTQSIGFDGLSAFGLGEEISADGFEDVTAFRPVSGDELHEIGEQVEAEQKANEPPAQSLTDLASGTVGETSDAPAGLSGAAMTANTAPKQMTMEDIQALNPDSTVIDIYTNDGYLSTLIGKYYEGKVTNVEEGVLSIQGMASLLGLSKGCDFFAVYSERNNRGYTFYTYQQRYGGNTLQYATLRVIVDPDGYTAGLSCSFVPNIGTASQEPKISAAEAENLIKRYYASYDLTYYPEHTVELAIPFNNTVYNCWVVYTNNPDATESFDIPYIEHCVTTDGQYLTLIPATDFVSSNKNALDNSAYFEGMEVQTLTKTVRLEDGTERTVSVPISYNSRDGKYYLIDPSRKIAVAQYYDFNYRGFTVNFVTSDTMDGWSQNNLLAYANYIILYDFYADHGIYSVDGFDTPILVTVGWCEQDGTPVNNACYYGVLNGWACFGVSDVNHSSDCVDVVGHEYTHGITNNSMQGCVYSNETGAINEAYSDIMGNLAEMSLGYTSDQNWLIGEHSGRISRNMSNPNEYKQPAYVGDLYYTPSVDVPNFTVNDYGGVHGNNSLLGHIAYRMGQTGMTYEQQISMWLNSIEILTPRSDYQDLHGALLFALKINGMLTEYGPALNAAFADAGLNDDWSESYLTATKPGCGRAKLNVGEEFTKDATVVMFVNTSTKVQYNTYPDKNGLVSLLLPAGNYITQLARIVDNKVQYFNYTESGWKSTGSFVVFPVNDGSVTDLTKSAGAPAGKTVGNSLTLIPFDGDYFSMLVPDGWRIEVNGEYGAWSVKLFDPNDISTQFFLYGALAPFHKSAEARRYWSQYDKTGIISNGPVLPQVNVLGLLQTWSYCIEYQKYYDKQMFTDLYDFYVVGANYFKGYYTQFGAVESAAVLRCATNYDSDCTLTICTSLLDPDPNAYDGNFYYFAYQTVGVLAPSDRYDDVIEDLLTCFRSLRFTRRYISDSQSSPCPMNDLETIIQGEQDTSDILLAIYHMYS